MWPPGHTASPVSANPRWPNCLARTCCAQRTRWSRHTPASRPSTSVSRLLATITGPPPPSSRRRRRPSSPRLVGTYGLPVRRRGARPSVPASGVSDGHSRPSRSQRGAAWPHCSATLRGSASTRSSPGMPRRRMLTDPRTRILRTMARGRPPSSQTTPGTATAWSSSPDGRGSWAGPRSGSRSGCATVQRTSPFRSPSRRRTASVA